MCYCINIYANYPSFSTSWGTSKHLTVHESKQTELLAIAKKAQNIMQQTHFKATFTNYKYLAGIGHLIVYLSSPYPNQFIYKEVMEDNKRYQKPCKSQHYSHCSPLIYQDNHLIC